MPSRSSRESLSFKLSLLAATTIALPFMLFGSRSNSQRTLSERIVFTLGGAVAIGAACVSYGILVEPRWYRRRAYRLEILSAGTTPLSVLHLSDLHFRPHDTSKARFLASLGQPDVVALTGDIIGDPGSVESAVQSLRPVRGRLASYFVLGSNDYFASKPLNY